MQGDIKTTAATQQTLDDANHNQGIISEELGGDEVYKEFFYGEGQKAVVELFHLANPEYLKGKTQKQYSDGLNNWWNGVRSNMRQFRTVQKNVGNFLLSNNIDVFRNNVIKQNAKPKPTSHKPSKGYSTPQPAKPSGNADQKAYQRYFS